MSPVAPNRARRKRGGRLRLLRRSHCPVANALEIIGDRWTLLIVRDMLMLGKSLYKEFAESEEGIPTNILAERLKRLQKFGIVEAVVYQRNPVRYSYHLTKRGQGLFPIMREMVAWSNAHIPGTERPPPGVLEALDRKTRS